MPNEVHLKTFRLLGANPTTLDAAEIYPALKQGVIDAQENPLGIILGWKFYEAQKYISLTGHFYSAFMVWMNKGFYDNLPADLQEVVRTGYKEMAVYQRQAQHEDFLAARDKLLAAGLKINDLTDEQKGLFREKCMPVYDWLGEKIGKDWVQKWVDATK
jgi:TRAP-type C4-dicarboxylate transport system substrate-binding protein